MGSLVVRCSVKNSKEHCPKSEKKRRGSGLSGLDRMSATDEGQCLVAGGHLAIQLHFDQVVENGPELGARDITHGLEVLAADQGGDLAQGGDVEGDRLLDGSLAGNGHEVKQALAIEGGEQPVGFARLEKGTFEHLLGNPFGLGLLEDQFASLAGRLPPVVRQWRRAAGRSGDKKRSAPWGATGS